MTPNEFKAWFDGFTEAFDGKIPTKAQWTRIQARVAEIDGKAVTERVYVDRHWPSYPLGITTYPRYTPMCTTTVCGTNIVAQNATMSGSTSSFNSTTAMYALGRAEAQNALS